MFEPEDVSYGRDKLAGRERCVWLVCRGLASLSQKDAAGRHDLHLPSARSGLDRSKSGEQCAFRFGLLCIAISFCAFVCRA